MKYIFALAAAAFSGFATAYYYDDSKPFRLFLKSDNSTINGTGKHFLQPIGACHQGAAIEGACLTGDTIRDPARSYTTFYHATVAGIPPYDNAGILYWNLTLGNGNGTTESVPSAMRFSSPSTSNLATPLFFPGNTTYEPISFAEGCESMYVPRRVDDTVSPPAYLDETEKVQNWYVCLTRYSYLYSTLEWKVGVTGEPQNPSCQKVSVSRVFN